MYKDYTELRALPPEAYLDWQAFATPNDGLPAAGYAEKQYATGLEYGKRALANDGYIFISCNGTWGIKTCLSTTTTFEGIGYHSCTADLWRGVLDSGCKIIVYRWLDGQPITETVITRGNND